MVNRCAELAGRANLGSPQKREKNTPAIMRVAISSILENIAR